MSDPETGDRTPDESTEDTHEDGVGASPSGTDHERPRWRKALDIVLPLLVVGLGVLGVWLLKVTAPSAERVEAQASAPQVETATAEAFAERPVVEASGTVRAARQARVAPRVRGPVSELSPRLVVGGHFEAGEPMLRVDPTDFRLAIEQREADIGRAELALTRAGNQQTVAQRSWDDFADPDDATSSGRSLALYEPQLDSARQDVDAAEAGLRQARLNLRRSRLRAPFDAVVIEEQVDEGQIVGPSAPVATLVGTDAFEVHASVPTEALPRLRLPVPTPGESTEARGAPARVTRTIEGETIGWDGYVARVLPNVEQGTSLARVAIVIPDPYGLDRDEGPRSMPLLIGSFVHVAIEAEPFEDSVTRLPRSALRGADRAWVVEDGKLRIRGISVVWEREESLLVRGIEPGADVVLGPIATPVDGMDVRTR